MAPRRGSGPGGPEVPRTVEVGRSASRPFSVRAAGRASVVILGIGPPALITPPVNNPPSTYVYGESLSTPGDAHGSNTNLHGEVDFYHFTATQGGTYLFDAASPGHAVDTVIAVYDSSEHRLAYDDNIAPGNTDSEASVALQAGHHYFLGVTNYISNTTHGSYNWSIDGPAHTAIEFKARALGSGFTGAVVSGLEAASGGYRIRYANCDIYDSPSTGAHEVHGAIRAEYNRGPWGQTEFQVNLKLGLTPRRGRPRGGADLKPETGLDPAKPSISPSELEPRAAGGGAGPLTSPPRRGATPPRWGARASGPRPAGCQAGPPTWASYLARE